MGCDWSLMKIILSSSFVSFGFDLNGALLGLVIAYTLGSLLYAGSIVSRFGAKKRNIPSVTLAIRDYIPILFAQIAFTTISQIDLVLVNYLYEAPYSSSYAAAAVLGKAVLYLPIGVCAILFPLVAEKSRFDRSSIKTFKDGLVLTSMMCLGAALTYNYFAETIIFLFFGDRHPYAAEVLRWYGFAMVPVAIIFLAEQFLIARNQIVFAWLLLLVAPIQLFLMINLSTSFNDLLLIIGVCSTAALFIGIGLMIKIERDAKPT